jgi:hypothetical protein
MNWNQLSMSYEWKRTLACYRRFVNQGDPKLKTALFLSGDVQEIIGYLIQLDFKLNKEVDVWMSPIHSHLKPLIEIHPRVRKVFICSSEKPMCQVKSCHPDSLRIYGRYERILVWQNGVCEE